MSEEKMISPDELSVEELFKQLEIITTNLEKEDISLEDSFDLYKRGVSMVKACGDKIDTIEKQMILLNESDNDN